MKRHGFTIIEFLVVISIIALLIALLLPSLGAAREQGRGIQCAANLRQLEVALYGYHEEHRGTLFGAWMAHPDWRYQWVYLSYHHTDPGQYWSPWGSFARPKASFEDKSMYFCPTIAREAFPQWTAALSGWWLSWTNYSIVMVDDKLLEPARITLIKRPSEVLHFVDWSGVKGPGAGNIWTNSTWYDTSNVDPHQETLNYLFYDGHVARMKASQITTRHFEHYD